MKKLILRLVCCIVLVVQARHLPAQLARHSDHDLFSLAKVWGLIKYQHPAVSGGRPDWDSVLLHTLNTPEQPLDQIISNWLATADKEKIGLPQNSHPKKSYDSVTLRNMDMDWVKRLRVTRKNKAALTALWQHPGSVGRFYSRSDSTKITYNSQNEKVYPGFSADLKLLELFRIWNVIEYFYPYRYLLEGSWDEVLKKYIPLFKSIKNPAEYQNILQLLAAEITDTHVNLKYTYLYNILGAYSAPFIFQLARDTMVVTGIKDSAKAGATGIAIGDLITGVNGKRTGDIINERKRYVPASNNSVTMREAYQYLFSSHDSSCTIQGVHPDGSAFSGALPLIKRRFNTEWDKDGIPDYQLYYRDSIYRYLVWDTAENRLSPGFRLGDIAYIDFSSLIVKDIDSLMSSYQDTKGLVFDLRGYTDNGALLKTFDYLFSHPQQFGIKTRPDFTSPGKFLFEDHIINEDYKYIGKDNPDAYRGKVVVLINEYTQSAMEMFAMIFKKVPGVIFIGSQTAGADGNKTFIRLTDGNQLYFSGLGIYYPDGNETQRIGIQPDIIIRPTVQSIREKRDLLLQKAFESLTLR